MGAEMISDCGEGPVRILRQGRVNLCGEGFDDSGLMVSGNGVLEGAGKHEMQQRLALGVRSGLGDCLDEAFEGPGVREELRAAIRGERFPLSDGVNQEPQLVGS
jgi:hypothetical protein